MEPAQIQLVVNVVMITGVTTLAGYGYLLRKEKRMLAAERGAVSKSERRDEIIQAVQSVTAPVTVTAIEQDIRNFAAGRRSGWVKNLASSITESRQEDSGR